MPAHSASQPSPPWAKAVIQTGREFPLTPLSVLSGQLPDRLRGTLYRNGPARLERGGQRMGHWFDGDGAILAVQFTEAGATGLYRYVQTAKSRSEEAAGKLLYGNYGTIAPGPIWQRWLKSTGNVANTSVLALPDKLLALWEAGWPHALNAETLDTWGTDNLGRLAGNFTYSAHPKVLEDEIFNFGLTPDRHAKLNLYRSDRTGNIVDLATVALDGIPLVHDFVVAGAYLVFFVAPVRMDLWSGLLGLSSFSDALRWQPQLGTQIWVFDRQTLNLVSRGEAEPWYQWHFANGYQEDDGAVVVDFVRYSDFTTNQRLKEIGAGMVQTAADGMLWRVRLNAQNGRVLSSEPLLDRSGEFPSVPPAWVGKNAPQIYLNVHRQGVDRAQDLYGAIACYDCRTSKLTEADLGESCYPTEPIFVPHPDSPDRGWVLAVVYDTGCEQSQVWIFEGDGLDREPVCRLGLPDVIPMGFHGTWQPASDRL
jgi:carotenoid cleavage dioxygenase-like enzyme